MKILILSCNTGEGHNSAAKAVLNEFIRRGNECVFADTLKFASERVSKAICDCYVNMTVKSPRSFKILYKAGAVISSKKRKSPVYFANKLYSEKLYRYITENKFDAVVTSHLFSAESLTALKHKHNLSISTYAIMTDYTEIPFWEETDLSFYFVPHKDLIAEVIKKGLPKKKLLPFGIPVDAQFSEKTDKIKACQLLSLNPDRHNYLIMSGSMGYGNLQAYCDALLAVDRLASVIIICGNNQQLQEQLENIYKAEENVKCIGFTNKVALYMDACDVLFTKPGGLSSTEAATKNIPLIHTTPIPGCETKNVEFFSSRGMSFYSENPTLCAAEAFDLATNPEKRKIMTDAQSENIDKDCCEKICSFILDGEKL